MTLRARRAWLVAVVLALVSVLAVPAGATPPPARTGDAAASPPTPEPLSGAEADAGLLVDLVEGVDPEAAANELKSEARRLGADEVEVVPVAPDSDVLVVTGVDDRVREGLSRRPEVGMAQPNRPLYTALSSSRVTVRADKTYDAGWTGVGVSVAIIDTGVDSLHPALAPAVVAEACFVPYDPTIPVADRCPNGEFDDTDSGSAMPPCTASQREAQKKAANDACNHGTHVAGIAAARPIASRPGVMGVAPGAGLVPVRIAAGNGYIDEGALVAGLDWVLKNAGTHQITAVNLSLATNTRYAGTCDGAFPVVTSYVQNLISAGVAVVAAAGNDGEVGGMSAPACIAGVLSVSATSASDARVAFSNVSSRTSMFAPGESILAPVAGGYGRMSGTSMAAPHVAGAIAVLRDVEIGKHSVNQLVQTLRATGRPISTPVGTIPRLDVWAASQAPLAPPSATATHGDRRATVSWAAASPGIGGPITGYRITVKPGGAQRTVSASTRSTTFTGLTNGTRYQLEVRALNSDGAGAVRTSNLVIPKPPPPPHGFVDVAAGAYYDQPVRWLKREGITTGVGGTNRFQPDAGVTRGQMATFLWRLMGTPSVSTAHGFVDVSSSAYYDPAVRWLKAAGITTGVGGTNRFEPNQIVTRDQMAAFLWRLVKSPTGYPAHGLVDVPSGAFYDAAVRWLKATGITTGVGGTNRYEPRSPVTRGQMAAFLHRLARNPAAWVKVPVGQIPNTIVF